ncbi:MAG TPA: FAD-dependent oxidoreductase [Polyangiaceae bacterium]|nr:FAD-dependent oxidoreductase [Polyangiaceae bacterium]
MQVLVIGAGIYGVSAAIELGERGHRVTLVDPGPLPHPLAASTDISKVVRLDYGADAFYTEMMEHALPRWRDDELFHETGFVILSRDEMRPGGFEYESHRVLSERGHRLDRLDPQQIARRFPAWRGYRDGYYNPAGGWAESGRVVARLLERAPIETVSIARMDQGVAISAQGDRLIADCTVVAAGAWTPLLLPELADRLHGIGQPVMHFRPRDAALFSPPAFPVWAADIARTGWYGFPLHPREGVVKIANHGPGTPIDPRAERKLPADAEAFFRAFLRDSLPSLADAPIEHTRLCLYCDSFDGDFFIDRHPERPGVVVAAGGSGHGFKFAPLLGGIIADAVEGVDNRWAHRFRWRERANERREDARSVTPYDA